nr:hypothetical protein [Tanacetum cinerariifolium]
GHYMMEIVIPKVGGIDDDILLPIKDDILCENLLNVNHLFAKIKELNDIPTPFHDLIISGTPLTLTLSGESDFFLEDVDAFLAVEDEPTSSQFPQYRSPTTYFDSSLYASFIFDISINPFPPADRSDFYEFADEPIHFISPSEYDCFLFKIETNSRDFTMDVVEDISLTRAPKVHNALPTHPTRQLNMKFQPSSEYIFTYVVWIFLPFLLSNIPGNMKTLANGFCTQVFISSV